MKYREDKAYSLLGFFGASMLRNSGEGLNRAFMRLQRETKAVGGPAELSDYNTFGLFTDIVRPYRTLSPAFCTPRVRLLT